MASGDLRAAGLAARVDPRLGTTGTVPLLLLHGAGGSHRHWRWTAEALPRWITPVALDLPGHGASDGPVPATLDATVAAVGRFVEAADLPLPFAAAGHSLGGLVALGLAARDPGTVSHLALLATAARIALHPDLVRVLAGAADNGFVAAALRPDTPAERVGVVVDDITRVRLAPGAGGVLGSRAIDLTDRLRSVAAATLVAWATGDPVISPRRSRALAAAITGSRTAEIDSGHYVMVERPTTVASLLVSLLSPAPAPPAAAGAGPEPPRQEPT